MKRIDIELTPEEYFGEELLRAAVRRKTGIPDSDIGHIEIVRRSLDSRRGIRYHTTVDVYPTGEAYLQPDYKGCYHCKGHTKFKGKGTLNVKGNSKHAIYSKEYIELKNCTINVTGAKKDAIHCQQYFRMASGVVNISQADDDGIQVELKGETATAGSDDEDEDTGNFYMTGGTLTINGVADKCIKTDGTISYTGGTQDFDTKNVEENAASGIAPTLLPNNDAEDTLYDLQGRQLPKGVQPKGLYIIKGKNKTQKRISY